MCFFVKYVGNLAIRDQNCRTFCVCSVLATPALYGTVNTVPVYLVSRPKQTPQGSFRTIAALVESGPRAVAPSQGLFLLCHQWLQSERQPANFSGVVEELFQVIPDEVLYMDASPERCRTCAVVGNSGNLKGSQYGRLIDSSDFIIRSVFPRVWQKCEHAVFFTELWRVHEGRIVDSRELPEGNQTVKWKKIEFLILPFILSTGVRPSPLIRCSEWWQEVAGWAPFTFRA